MPQTQTEELKATDRCDRCGARAAQVTFHAAGELMWCNHHFREHEDRLLELA